MVAWHISPSPPWNQVTCFVVSWFCPLHLWDIEMTIGFIFSSSENVIQVVGDTVFQYQWQEEWLKLIIALMRATSHQHFRTLAKFMFQIKWFGWLVGWVQFLFIFLFTFNVLPATISVLGFALVITGHHGITIWTIHSRPLWWHWGEDQRCRWRDALRARGNRRRGVLKKRGAPEYLLLGGFNFTFSNLNVFPYPLLLLSTLCCCCCLLFDVVVYSSLLLSTLLCCCSLFFIVFVYSSLLLLSTSPGYCCCYLLLLLLSTLCCCFCLLSTLCVCFCLLFVIVVVYLLLLLSTCCSCCLLVVVVDVYSLMLLSTLPCCCNLLVVIVYRVYQKTLSSKMK